MTPMTLLKDHFNTLHSLLPDTIPYFELHGHKPKHNPVSEITKTPENSKGVLNDFIRIYKLSDILSFSFGFKGVEGKTGIIEIGILDKSIQDENNRYNMVQYNFEDTKTKLKIFNKKLKVLNLSNIDVKDNILGLFESVFLNK